MKGEIEYGTAPFALLCHCCRRTALRTGSNAPFDCATIPKPTDVSLVAAGMGVSLVPLSTRNIRSQGVVYRELEGTVTQTEMAVAWLRNSHSALVQNFLAVAKEIARSLA